MKYLFSVLLLLSLTLSLVANSQPKTVYVSIDVSISMRGDKYNLANYTVQMITQLMEKEDELYLGMGGQYRKISTDPTKRKETLASVQRTLQSLNIDWRDSEANDIKVFNEIFNSNSNRDQWFFIVGDGYWELDDICDNFKIIISEAPIKVYFLETMKKLTEHGEFGECLDPLSFVTQYRSSNDPQTIIDNCTKVATSLFGISDESASARKIGNKRYSFTSLLPVSKVYITYQDKINTTDLASLQSASSLGKDITISRQSTISTEKIRTSKNESLISGQVIVLTPDKPLTPNEPIELTFDKDIDLSKLNIYPMVDIQPGIIDVVVKNGLAETSGNTSVVCLDNDKATITYELTDNQGKPLPASILERTIVKIKSKNGEVSANLINGVFQYEMPLGENVETIYTIEAECAGYFKIISNKRKIVRDGNCVQAAIKKEPIIIGSIRSGDIKDDACIKAQIVNRDNPDEVFNPKEYNLEIKRDYRHLFRSVKITNITDTDFEFCFKSYGMWCECFLPDTLILTVYATPKNGKGGIIEQPIQFHIDKSDSSWFARCKWVIGLMLGLFLLILYLMGLNKKKRFKKGSVIRYQYFGVGGIKSRENIDDLRKKGFFAWFNRWFIPFSVERSSKLFAKAGNKLFSFSATQSNQRVEIPKSQYNPKAMTSIDFDRDQFERKTIKTFTITDNTYIKITLPNGTGSFQFCYDKSIGIKDDVSAFRAFCSTLIFIAVILELFLGYFLITSLF